MRKNIELISLCKTLGLDFKNSYANGIEGQGLRYGNVMIMCDQDNDGSHIKGLVINFFQYFWPNLLKIDGFLQQFVTPLVKVKIKSSSSSSFASFSSSSSSTSSSTSSTSSLSSLSSDKEKKKDKSIDTDKKNDTMMIKTFFSMPQYDEWRRSLKSDITDDSNNSNSNSSSSSSNDNNNLKMKKLQVKYYKGLGTNTAEEGKTYFKDLNRHKKTFLWGPGDLDAIDLGRRH